MKYKFNTWYYNRKHLYKYVIDAIGESIYSGGEAYFGLEYFINRTYEKMVGSYSYLHPNKWPTDGDDIEKIPELNSYEKQTCITEIFEKVKT